jgi:hypothetical protein
VLLPVMILYRETNGNQRSPNLQMNLPQS